MGVLRILVLILMFSVMIRAILSWFPSKPGSLMAKIQKATKINEPVLKPVRRVVPPVGWKAFRMDLSPAIVLVMCQLVLLPVLS
jgi:uncharacterized protein YggT (Ycf19 family)